MRTIKRTLFKIYYVKFLIYQCYCMVNKKIKSFLDSLVSYDSDISTNPYKEKIPYNNLLHYLDYLYNLEISHIFVGEAPGYWGCRFCGIPFSSGEMIYKKGRTIFRDLKQHLIYKEIKNKKENTAKIMYEFLNYKDFKSSLFWNTFPFHPYDKDKTKNRKPNNEEVAEGRTYLSKIIDLFGNPDKLYAIGIVSFDNLKSIYDNKVIEYVRHPSFGGKRKKKKKMSEIYGRNLRRFKDTSILSFMKNI